jgi:hypothetical protein
VGGSRRLNGTVTPVPDGSDILELLAADHHRIEAALALEGKGMDVVRELSMHLYAEEEALHPVVRHRVTKGDDLADDLLEGDRRLLQALAEAEEKGHSHGTPEVKNLFARHMASFEATAGPTRAQVPQEELIRLGEVLLATLPEAPTHPHPHLFGQRGPLKPLVDGAASAMDHLRDRRHEKDEDASES